MADFKLLSDDDLEKVIGGGDGYNTQSVAGCLFNYGSSYFPNIGALIASRNWDAIDSLIENNRTNPIVQSCLNDEK